MVSPLTHRTFTSKFLLLSFQGPNARLVPHNLLTRIPRGLLGLFQAMAEARFVGMLDYLAALKRSKLTADQAKMDALFQACVLDIENAPPISMEVGTSLLKTLGSADLPEKWREDLTNLVQKKVQAGIGEQSLKKRVPKTQHCENL